MKFFEIEDLFNKLNIPISYSINDIENLKKAVQNSKEEFLVQEKSEIVAFLAHHNSEKKIVFYQWITDCTPLFELVNSEKLTEINFSKFTFYKHQWFEEFKAYLTPFLYPILIQLNSERIKFSDKYLVLLYTQLLNEEKSFELHFKINKEIKNLISQESSSVSDFDLYFVKAVNELLRDFYSTRVEIIDKFKDLVLSTRYSLEEKKQLIAVLKHLEVNKNHKESIKKFTSKAQQKGYYITQEKKPSFKRFVILLLLIVVIFAAWFGYKKYNDILVTEKPAIPPYGTDSLTENEIEMISSLFSKGIDTIGEEEIPLGIEYSDSLGG